MLSTRVCTPCAHCDCHVFTLSEDFARQFVGGTCASVTASVPSCCSRCHQGLSDYLYYAFWGLFSSDEYRACPTFCSAVYTILNSIVSSEPTTVSRTMFFPSTMIATICRGAGCTCSGERFFLATTFQFCSQCSMHTEFHGDHFYR